jgi:hypothetical protein
MGLRNIRGAQALLRRHLLSLTCLPCARCVKGPAAGELKAWEAGAPEGTANCMLLCRMTLETIRMLRYQSCEHVSTAFQRFGGWVIAGPDADVSPRCVDRINGRFWRRQDHTHGCEYQWEGDCSPLTSTFHSVS